MAEESQATFGSEEMTGSVFSKAHKCLFKKELALAPAAATAHLSLWNEDSTTEDPPCCFALVLYRLNHKPNKNSWLSFLCNIAGILCLPRRLKLMDASITGCLALG